ncbi:MAG: hypothetical protein DRN15_04865 [Thermoprotei archaeon]|nr:MAG: hypothetical protein DRN15_04865 [Thermoprotei archaeon]RLF25514.1 MAG: hypothetical protein DRM97_01570 [Thermoprotei archaeon]
MEMSYEYIERITLANVTYGRYGVADRIARAYARLVYDRFISKMSEEEVFRIIDEVTGGLGYRRNDFNVMRMSYCGSIIAWPEAVSRGDKVLEIGTGIGRTCYVIVNWSQPSLYVTIDKSPEILAIALYRNPVNAYRDALNSSIVKILLCDATKAVPKMSMRFDHIVHDGGPCPSRNPSLFSKDFLEQLSLLLKPEGTMSIFAGRNKKWQDRIYKNLRELGFRVETESFPDSPVIVFHCTKIKA